MYPPVVQFETRRLERRRYAPAAPRKRREPARRRRILPVIAPR